LAKSLIKHLQAPFKPEQFADTYRQNVERLIKQKQKGQQITTVEQPRKAPVIDLMEALKRSLHGGTTPKSAAKTARAKKGARRRTAA
jgi:DNA end-binding protein Ku